ncbi:hypothetical protein, partial [Pseudomonas viridiflava]|uniref:hypothetical protein n=1 Tax=Pseudomonas viridiflava TaxID=33069 RepID=UPI00197E8152
SAAAQQTPDWGRWLAGDAVDAVCQENRVIVHRRQAASHKKRVHSADHVLFDKRRLPEAKLLDALQGCNQYPLIS